MRMSDWSSDVCSSDLQQSGEVPVWTLVFDGSGEGGLSGVSAVLSQRLPAGAPTQLASPLLEDVPSWLVNLAFYNPDAGEPAPEQEQAVRLFANGLIAWMRPHSGDFDIEPALHPHSPLPPP